MTEFENHKTLLEHNSALFKRLTSFYFVNYYTTFFYIAFVKVFRLFDKIVKNRTCRFERSL